MERFTGKVALVNGAGGIGGATAVRLAAEGAAVMVLDIDPDAAATTVRDITDAGGIAQAIQGDLGDEASMHAAVRHTVSELGGIDVMANIAYVGGGKTPEDLDVVRTPQEVWDRILGVNLMGFVRACRLAIPHMVERGGGAIVNVSSGTAIVAEKVRIAYATSKVAITGITRNIAIQYAADGIRVNCLVPGTTATPNAMRNRDPELSKSTVAGVPLGRMGRPEEMAAVIAFFLSDDAAYVTGQTLIADGGYSVSAYH